MHKDLFDNSQTGGFMVTLSVFMQLWQVFQIIMKNLYLLLGPISGMRLILECDLYGNGRHKAMKHILTFNLSLVYY